MLTLKFIGLCMFGCVVRRIVPPPWALPHQPLPSLMASSSLVSAERLEGLICEAAEKAARSVASQFIPIDSEDCDRYYEFVGNQPPPPVHDGVHEGDHTPMYHDGSRAAVDTSPFVFTNSVDNTNGTAFPPGIQTLEKWGETVVPRGLKVTGRTFKEVLEWEEFASYRKTVLEYKNPGPVLADLKAYLICAGANNMKGLVTSEPIPGTLVPRLRRPAVKSQVKEESGKEASSTS